MSGRHRGPATYPVPTAPPRRHGRGAAPMAGRVALAAIPLAVGAAMLIGPLVGAPAAAPGPAFTAPTLPVPHTPLLRTP